MLRGFLPLAAGAASPPLPRTLGFSLRSAAARLRLCAPLASNARCRFPPARTRYCRVTAPSCAYGSSPSAPRAFASPANLHHCGYAHLWDMLYALCRGVHGSISRISLHALASRRLNSCLGHLSRVHGIAHRTYLCARRYGAIPARLRTANIARAAPSCISRAPLARSTRADGFLLDNARLTLRRIAHKRIALTPRRTLFSRSAHARPDASRIPRLPVHNNAQQQRGTCGAAGYNILHRAASARFRAACRAA